MTAEPDQGARGVVTVLVVDDSPVQRRFLRAALDASTGFDVVGEARNGREAVAMVERLQPATVLMDLDLPVMNGIEAIERIMATRPTPIVVCSGYLGEATPGNAHAAQAAGAVDIVAKPGPGDDVNLDEYADELRKRLRVASRVKVITHPRGRLRGGHAPRHVVREKTNPEASTTSAVATKAEPKPSFSPLTTPIQLLAIGASTGGPQALAQLLPMLPADLEQAVLVVQHMADGFIEGLATWLDGLCPLPVVVGASGKRLSPGTITIAPSGLNLIVHDRLRVVCEAPPVTQFHVPGIDATFTSIAESLGAEALGVLLTGMGRDGALGLKAMRQRGALTIGQDEASSAVWGMPGAAHALGAVEHELPLDDIGPALLTLLDREVGS
ncbi:MAG: two-component system, chemotaxis family, protein-glutamate methylesterase/glutaminase [Frankiaceae bacterium]|jgi:two-component system chemotaxis response regulator CheB|nr:two-component system, chemotaxis family, protein-glutamate methylesterase/glutaminase [Frankiaceae bacterium]MDX6274192.1 two-component system, chemotaxis family, protein-glutamate methylesterase/glutaminase [Frankiales bacterium]